jgi:hypothetical protein
MVVFILVLSVKIIDTLTSLGKSGAISNTQSIYPSYVLHNVFPNHKNIFTRHEYSHLHDIYISPNSEKINDGYIDWVFDIAPDLPSDVKVSIIFTDNTKINTTIKEIKSWRPVKKFKIIT